jgi:Lon protease-like protein
VAALPPGLAGLPTEFPVFPLAGALLLPQGKLPLNIFEPRYLALVEDALAPPRMFGMIMPGASESRLYQVGCLGRLSSFSETDDGRYLITLTGIVRFTVAEELAMRRGYRRVRGDFSTFAADLDTEQAVPDLDREALFTALHGYFERRGFEANWDAMRDMPERMLLVTLAMACPFGVAEKQALLEAPAAADLATVLLALLRMDLHDRPDQGRQVS